MNAINYKIIIYDIVNNGCDEYDLKFIFDQFDNTVFSVLQKPKEKINQIQKLGEFSVISKCKHKRSEHYWEAEFVSERKLLRVSGICQKIKNQRVSRPF